MCNYKKEIGSGRLRCEHPAVLEIEKSLEEKSFGLILATALNKIGKALKVEVASDAYEKDKWMSFPFYYYKGAVVSCEGFKRVKVSTRKGGHMKDITATYDGDSKRYHRFLIDTGQKVTGAIYIPKDEPVPDNLTIQLRTKGEKPKRD